MSVKFTDNAWEDYNYWLAQDKKIFKRLNELIKEIKRTPYEGRGKPEKLRHALSGCWSRRLTDEHRIVYKVTADGEVVFLQLRYHY